MTINDIRWSSATGDGRRWHCDRPAAIGPPDAVKLASPLLGTTVPGEADSATVRTKSPASRATTRRSNFTMKPARTLLAAASASLIGALATGALAADGAATASTADKGIALSNSYAGNSWRQVMIRAWEKAANQAISDGVIAKTKVVNANNSATEQASQIENLILEGWNAIVIDAGSPTALNGTIEEACAAGIVVVVFDGIATAPCAYKVTFDFVRQGTLMTEFMAKQLGGKGNLIEVRGIAGVATDDDVGRGTQEILAGFPDLKIVATVNGEWTPPVAQKEVAAILPSLPQIDGALVQGAGYGVYQAFKAAGRPIPPIIFGNYQEEFVVWNELLAADPNYKTISIAPAPSVSTVAFWVAQQILAGKEVPKDLIVPLLVIDSDNLAAWTKATPAGEVAAPIYSRDWTVEMIDAVAAGKPLPADPSP
jgi:ribose transport system substrate-binding protein